MKRMSRREVCVGLPALAVVGAGVSRGQVYASEFPGPQGQQPTIKTVPENDKPGAPMAVAGRTVGPARAIRFESMPGRTNAGGGESWDIAHGTLATGETVSLHQSMQVVGQAAPALHVIQHSEFICVREGELEFQHEVDGKLVAERVGAGGVIYVAFGTKHAARNVGTVPAKYFVLSIGGDAK